MKTDFWSSASHTFSPYICKLAGEQCTRLQNNCEIPVLFLFKLLADLRGAVCPKVEDEPLESSSAHKKKPQPLSLFEHL